MPRGGKRPGAGRRPGTLSKKTIARQQQASAAAENGISPLELMLKRMRYHNQMADRELEKGAKADHDKIEKALHSASEAARDAAPYVHPRLSAIEHARGGQVNVLHELFKVIDGTGRGLPDPANEVTDRVSARADPSRSDGQD